MSTPTKEPPKQGTGDGDHRNNIFEFFRSHTAFDMLPESGKVCLLDSSLSANAALSIMAANQQLAVPVWDGLTDSYMGMLTVTDLVEMVLTCSSSKAHSSCQEGLKALTLEDWMCHHPRPHGCPLPSVEVRPDDDLMHVLWTLVRNNCRVVPVLEREGGRKDTAMLSQCLVGQISYLLLFRFLFYHQSKELETLQGTLLDVGIGTFASEHMFTVKATDGVRSALEVMSHRGISGVPVVDDDGRLVGIFCDADILMYTPEFLSLDLGTALKQARAAAEAGTGAGSEAGSGESCAPNRAECSCRSDDPLRTVVSKFNHCKTTRLACTSSEGKVEGVVTLTDLFKFLAGSGTR